MAERARVLKPQGSRGDGRSSAVAASPALDGVGSAPGPTSDRLLSTAAALFKAKGYEATTTRELAAALGIRSPSLYHHINRKEDLLYELCRVSLTRINETVKRTVEEEPEPRGRLRAVIRDHVLSALSDQDMHATMLLDMRALSPGKRRRIVGLRRKYQDLLESVIRGLQDEGVVRGDISPKYLCLALLNLLNWTIFWYLPDGELEPKALAEILSSIFIEGARLGEPPLDQTS